MDTTPLTLSALIPRNMDEIAAVARTVQANLYSLKTSWCKRTKQDSATHEIQVQSPGAIHEHRDILIDWRIIRDYSDEEIALRLRQVWGEFCGLCWVFPFSNPLSPPDFAALPPNQTLRCLNDLHHKLDEIQTGLWIMKHEQKLRFDPNARLDAAFQREHEITVTRRFMVYGVGISECNNEDLLCCACEYAGMLAALRWTTDNRWGWEAPGIMELSLGGDNQTPA